MKKLLLLLLFSFITLFSVHPTFAESADELTKQLQDKQAEIQKLEAQLNETIRQEKTLKSQLNIIDSQTKVTLLKIEETDLKIEKLKREISGLSTRINRIGANLDLLSGILLQRIVQTYKYNNTVSTINLLFSSHGFADLIQRLKYIQVAQAYDKKKLYELQATKMSYNDQKQDKEIRQQEAEKLNKELENYKAQLDQQKKDKEELLRITRNDEGRYQQLIAKLRADTDSLARALAGGGVKLGPVKKGDRIAVVGNSGCSTGPHLHFEVITPARIDGGRIVDSSSGQPIGWGLDHRADPRPYIVSNQFYKPVAEFTDNDACSQDNAPPPSCNNGDISTRFRQSYIMGTHTGLDIANYFGAPIYAVDDGDSYAIADSVPCTKYTGTIGKGVAIDHRNGVVTLYWHIP